jgi:hypothetical protein
LDLGLVRHHGSLLDGTEIEDLLLSLGIDTSSNSSEEGGSLLRLLLLMVDEDLHLLNILRCSVYFKIIIIYLKYVLSNSQFRKLHPL